MKRARWTIWALLVATMFAAVASRLVMAQEQAPPAEAQAQPQAQQQGQPQVDPPGRVARLNFVQGSVSFQPAGGGDNDWTTAIVNRPMSTGDRLWTDQDGRAELHVGSTAIRIDHNTGISFLALADNSVQLQLSAGSAIIRLRKLDMGDGLEVDAPNLAFSILQPGDYRLDADPDKNVTTVAVVQGKGTVTGGGRSWDLTADQRATFSGTDNLQYDLADVHASAQTDFDTWCAGRDKQDDQALSASSPTARNVSPDVTGSEDLNTYGAWQTDPTYGQVWTPSGVPADWAPYHYGHWVWMAPWGWTWVEDEPWGFAPFHYGRWVFVGAEWAWVPGPVAVRPVYAPALVAWVGGTPGFSFSVAIGGGGVGWFPLGPREVFVPAYHVSDVYVTRVNVTNTVVERTTVINVYHNNVTNVTYVNQRVNGGVTVVSHDTFVNARPVARNVVVVPQRELAGAPMAHTFAATPVHASFVGEGRPATARPPAAILNRTVVTARTPAPAPARFGGEQPGGRGAAFGNTGNNPPVVRGGQPSQSPSGYRPPTSGPIEQGTQPAPQEQRGGFQGANGNPPSGSVLQPPPVESGNRSDTRTLNEPGALAASPQQPRGGFEGGTRNPGAPPSASPNTRPAPPVHQPTPAEQQVDAAKQAQYQQQHEQVHPRGKPAGKPGRDDDRRH